MHDLESTGPITYRRIATNYGQVEFADVGQGPPVLYFHGSGAGADAVLRLEQPLIDDGFRLIIPHRPGYFETPLDDRQSSIACAELAAGLLDHLDIDRAAVIGMSSGGMAATTFAREYPNRTAALILECALCHPLSATKWMPRHFSWTFPLMRKPSFGRLLFRLAYQLEVTWVRLIPKHLIAHTAGDRKAEILDDVRMQAMLPDLVKAATDCAKQPDGVINDYARLFGEPWLEPRSVHCPTLIVHDLADPVARLSHVEWAMECIPRAELCDLHLGGHLIWVGRDAERMRIRRREFIAGRTG